MGGKQRKPVDEQETELQINVGEGRDEMNLAEFPLCCIADRPSSGQKTLSFEDRTWDPSRNDYVTRQLLISGSNEYGLPTARDDEVLLGLIQISKLRDFADREVHFTRYQLIRLLDWRDEGKSYERLEMSLNRWMGVTLYYKNAWWDKAEQSWVSAKFHVLDNVILFDREDTKRKKTTPRQTQMALSTFVWNEVIFRSFKAGNLKGIDFELCKSLQSSIAKRLYRFLDKRFYHRKRWAFELKELCWEHLGLARTHDAANLKRKLRPALTELEGAGFIKPARDEKRFQRVCSGEWRMTVESPEHVPAEKREIVVSVSPGQEELKAELINRGVSLTKAAEIVIEFSLEQVQNQVQAFDWLLARQDPKVARNPAGFLVSAIRNQYSVPTDFQNARATQRLQESAKDRKKLDEQKRKKQEQTIAEDRTRQETIADFWSSMTEENRAEHQQKALDTASSFYRDLLQNNGTLGTVAKKEILDRYALGMLGKVNRLR